MILEFKVPVEPAGKSRPRAVSWRPRGDQSGQVRARVYQVDSDAAQAMMRGLAIAILDGGPDAPVPGPVFVDRKYSFKRPKSHYRANGALKDDAPTYCTKKPDLDNIDKILFDALTQNGVLVDDSQIVAGSHLKLWGDPSIHVIVRTLGGDE